MSGACSADALTRASASRPATSRCRDRVRARLVGVRPFITHQPTETRPCRSSIKRWRRVPVLRFANPAPGGDASARCRARRWGHTVSPIEGTGRGMFVAWRDLTFAKGRFALMGAVVVLITLLVGLLSGLTAGLARQNVSAVTGLPADRLAFAAPAGGQDLSYADSVVTEAQWRHWARVPGVTRAEPLGITTTRANAGDRSAGVSVFGVLPGSPLAPAGERVEDGTVVLSTAAAGELGVGEGDAVTLAGRELTVAAARGDAFLQPHTRRLGPPWRPGAPSPRP
ncbi:ABC transporter, permease, partial [Streptomyces griseoflavus Tu4000]